MNHKNAHLKRHIQLTETQQELRNSRLHPKTKRKLHGKMGGLKNAINLNNLEEK